MKGNFHLCQPHDWTNLLRLDGLCSRGASCPAVLGWITSRRAGRAAKLAHPELVEG